MRFSVECAFPHLRKRGVASRKSALCTRRLTEKRILRPGAPDASRKSAFCMRAATQIALFREGMHVECAFPSHPARRLRFSVECAFPHLRKRGVASRKSALCDPAHPTPHAKAHSAPDGSRKSAFCMRAATQIALFREGMHVECAFPSHPARRLRFSVECAFPHLRKRGVASRKSALCDPAHPTPHAKAHSAPDGSRKSAL